MRRRILWLTFWMTFVFCLGHGTGCTLPIRLGAPCSRGPIAHESEPEQQMAQLEGMAKTSNAEQELASTSDPVPENPDLMYGPTAPFSETEPSLVGMDRSNWPRIIVGTADGTVTHGPIYFRDCPIRHEQRPIDNTWEESEKLRVALDRAMADHWSAANLVGGFANPPKFGFDLLTLPIEFVKTPVWTTQSTP